VFSLVSFYYKFLVDFTFRVSSATTMLKTVGSYIY